MNDVIDKLNILINKVNRIESLLTENNNSDIRTAIDDLKQAVRMTEEKIDIEGVSNITDIIFDEVNRRNSQGILLQATVSITDDGKKYWYMRNFFYEQYDGIPIDKALSWINAINSPIRIKILHLVFKGLHKFGELRDSLDILDGTIGHHLNLLVNSGLLIKEKRNYYTLSAYGAYILFFILDTITGDKNKIDQ